MTAEPGLVARLGLALTSPRWALASAADRRNAGRSGSDLMILILLVLAGTQLRGLFAAGWIGTAVELSLGFRAAVQVLTRTLGTDLAFLLVAAIVLWLAGGPRRDLGRAFDLACVAAVPMLVVALVATATVRALDVELPGALGFGLVGVAFAWAGALVALALRPARQRPVSVPAPPVPVTRRGRLAGWAIVAVAALGTAVQAQWLVRHADLVRPMTQGDAAPAFALPQIEAGGTPGAAVALEGLRGKVVVLDFWATWCKPCLAAMPALDAIAKNPDVVVVAVNLDDAAAARALWDQRGYRMTLLVDDGQVSTRYGVTTIPHTVVIDRAGVVRMVARGNSPQLEATVTAIAREEIRK